MLAEKLAPFNTQQDGRTAGVIPHNWRAVCEDRTPVDEIDGCSFFKWIAQIYKQNKVCVP